VKVAAVTIQKNKSYPHLVMRSPPVLNKMLYRWNNFILDRSVLEFVIISWNWYWILYRCVRCI